MREAAPQNWLSATVRKTVFIEHLGWTYSKAAKSLGKTHSKLGCCQPGPPDILVFSRWPLYLSFSVDHRRGGLEKRRRKLTALDWAGIVALQKSCSIVREGMVANYSQLKETCSWEVLKHLGNLNESNFPQPW
ncbi:hypothetical protein M9H77_03726 [Catharanthus roseus]|uniref:Uncharacterized protein n=1 Tax=Catharanthus roseus TaxID=4058 RepID=A0ACC0CCK9_CATRO|nr:hypothetical protein M9H77_03726 [Catharanthus roseus]